MGGVERVIDAVGNFDRFCGAVDALALSLYKAGYVRESAVLCELLTDYMLAQVANDVEALRALQSQILNVCYQLKGN